MFILDMDFSSKSVWLPNIYRTFYMYFNGSGMIYKCSFFRQFSYLRGFQFGCFTCHHSRITTVAASLHKQINTLTLSARGPSLYDLTYEDP